MSFNYLFSTIDVELNSLNRNLQQIVSARHPVLSAASEHLFDAGGKRLRPAIIFFIAQATNSQAFISDRHRRLAEITEIIHTASLIHDDIVDDCPTRRGVLTVHSSFSTKVAILAGDYLFAKSSWYLANLDSLKVVKAISKVITDFAEGEIRQGLASFNFSLSLNQYVEKSFYKTASLIAASCVGSGILSDINAYEQKSYYLYGKHMGLAFQIIDDVLDLIGSSQLLGKPTGEDLRNGNLTAPLLFALPESLELQQLVNREFERDNDINRALILIKTTYGLEKARDLAVEHIQAAINILPSSIIQSESGPKNLILISQYMIRRLS